LLRDLSRAAIFFLDTLIDLFSEHADTARRFDSQLDLMSLDFEDAHTDVVPDHNAFLHSSG
jgi:hypothetical protein